MIKLVYLFIQSNHNFRDKYNTHSTIFIIAIALLIKMFMMDFNQKFSADISKYAFKLQLNYFNHQVEFV